MESLYYITCAVYLCCAAAIIGGLCRWAIKERKPKQQWGIGAR